MATTTSHKVDNAALRNRTLALNFWKVLTQTKPLLSVSLHEKTFVNAKFECCDATQEMIGVTELETPLGTYPNAQLRQKDILYMEVELTNEMLRNLIDNSVI